MEWNSVIFQRITAVILGGSTRKGKALKNRFLVLLGIYELGI